MVGAGAVGLAIARKLAERDGTSTLLIERHGSVGTETSSRNSEVSKYVNFKLYLPLMCIGHPCGYLLWPDVTQDGFVPEGQAYDV